MFAPVHDIIIAAVLCRGNSVAWAAIFVIHSTYTSSHDEELSLPVRYLTRGQQWQFYIAKHGWPQPDGRPNEPSSPRGHRDSRGRNERLIYRHYRAHHAVRVRRYGGGGVTTVAFMACFYHVPLRHLYKWRSSARMHDTLIILSLPLSRCLQRRGYYGHMAIISLSDSRPLWPPSNESNPMTRHSIQSYMNLYASSGWNWFPAGNEAQYEVVLRQ